MSKAAILKKVDTMKKHFMLFAVGFTGVYIFLFLIYLFLQVIHPLVLVRDGVKFMHKNLTKFKFKLKSNDEINEIYDNVNFLVDKINEDLSTQDKFKDNMLEFNDLRLEEILKVLLKILVLFWLIKIIK
jgi:signal transduction histidine kinase